METFEQALNKAFEIAWRRSLEVDRIRETKGTLPANPSDDLLVAGVEQVFVGTLDILGSLLLLAGRISTFEPSPGIDGTGNPKSATDEWIDGFSETVGALMEWAYDNGKIDHVQYVAWSSLNGPARTQ